MLQSKVIKLLFFLFSQRKVSDYRSSHPEVFCTKGAFRNVAKLTGKHLCQSLFLNKFCEISKNIFFTEHVWTTASVSF